MGLQLDQDISSSWFRNILLYDLRRDGARVVVDGGFVVLGNSITHFFNNRVYQTIYKRCCNLISSLCLATSSNASICTLAEDLD